MPGHKSFLKIPKQFVAWNVAKNNQWRPNVVEKLSYQQPWPTKAYMPINVTRKREKDYGAANLRGNDKLF